MRERRVSFSLSSVGIFLVTFCVSALILLILIWGLENYREQGERKRMEYLASSKSHKITEVVIGLLYKAEALAALVVQGDGKIESFERVAAILVTDPAIRNILLAPDGIVSHVYPLEDNKRALGFNLLGEGRGNKEALIARKTGRLTLGGPFETVQGGQALVGRLPVYITRNHERIFWGLVSVTLRYPEALRGVDLDDLRNQGYACKIWRISPDTHEKQIILESDDTVLRNPVERRFDILNAQWMISIAPMSAWYGSYIFPLYLAATLGISALVAGLVQNYCETRKMKAMMEHMAMFDSLTGLPNRRCFFEKLHEEIARCAKTGGRFLLGYLDLNNFKQINDTCGHKAGDAVLVETAARLRQCLDKKHLMARLGGDEFVFLVRDTGKDPNLGRRLFELLGKELQKPIVTEEGRGFVCSASIGMAVFPTDGGTAEELLAHADACMYEKKLKARTVRR